jgi:hypothetical protein
MTYLRSTYAEQDVIWTGDFNLEYDLVPGKDTAAEVKLRSEWDTILLQNPKAWPGATVLVGDLTSISDKERLKSNYDHFILDTKSTVECAAKTAHSVDFTVKGVAPLMDKYTVLLNEKIYGDAYDKEEPLSVTQLIDLANSDPEGFEALTEEQRLGMSFVDARSLGELKTKNKKQFDIRKTELEELMLDLKRRKMEAHLKSAAGAGERQKIQSRVAELALSLQNLWGVFEDTINGKLVASFQPKYPQGDASEISPERKKRATEYDKIMSDFPRRVFDSQWVVDPRTAKDVRYQVYREMISDHLPIDMECPLPARDDD